MIDQNMQLRVLTPAQVEHFITRCWVQVKEAFPHTQAEKVQDFLWDKLAERGVLRDDRTTWKTPMEFIAENYNGSPFDECATPRLADAITDLVGDGRWIAQHEIGWWGWWPINFAIGADQVWDVPADEWHFDSPDNGTHVTSPHQGMLVICLFSELEPRGGGTLILEGSHHVVARFFEKTPGLTQREAINQCLGSHPYLRALTGRDGDGENLPGVDTSNKRNANAWELQRPENAPRSTPRIEQFMNQTWTDEDGTELRVVEITGSPGDVFLGHPFLFHSPSFNHAGRPRFMCNRKTPLFEELQLEREDGEYSALEESIRRALGISEAVPISGAMPVSGA